MFSFKCDNEKGMTLLEILLAFVILLIFVMAIIPLSTITINGIHSNKVKSIATGLASSVIEEARTLPFIVNDPTTGLPSNNPNVPQLGVQGGNPPGSLPGLQIKSIDNINYTIRTSVSWVEDAGILGYKKIIVEVETDAIISGKTNKVSKVATLAAKEGESEIFDAGVIKVELRGATKEPFKQSGINVVASNSAGISQFATTDNEGVALFGIIPYGDYTLTINVPSNLVGNPAMLNVSGELERTIIINDWNTQTLAFLIDNPVYLSINFKEFKNDQYSDFKKIHTAGVNSKLNLLWSYLDSDYGINEQGKVLKTKTISVANDNNSYSDNVLNSNFLGKIWPGGKYDITIEGIVYTDDTNLENMTMIQAYDSINTVDIVDNLKPFLSGNINSKWDGTFFNNDEVQELIAITLPIVPLLEVWLSSDSLNLNDNDAIALWEDKSGNEYNAIQENINNRPRYISNSINNKPSISFAENIIDAEATPPTLASSFLTLPTDSRIENTFDIFLVAEPSETRENGSENLSGTQGTSGQKYVLYPNQEGVNAGMGISLGTNGLANYEHGNSYLPATAIFLGNMSGYNLTNIKYSNKQPFIYTNSVLRREGLISTKNTVLTPMRIGGGHWGDFTGSVAEILIFKSDLNDDQRQFISDYLMEKYNL